MKKLLIFMWITTPESENRSCFLLVVKEKVLIGFEKK
jgi:hypothetical protein